MTVQQVGANREIRTSDDLGVSYQLRDASVNTVLQIGGNAQNAMAERTLAVPRSSVNNGVAWANAAALAADIRAFAYRGTDWYAGAGTGFYRATVFPNFNLVGNIAAGVILSIAGLRS